MHIIPQGIPLYMLRRDSLKDWKWFFPLITCTYWTGFTCNFLLWFTVCDDSRLWTGFTCSFLLGLIVYTDLRLLVHWTGFTCNIILLLNTYEDLRLFSIWFKNYAYHVMCVVNRLHLWHSFLRIWGYFSYDLRVRYISCYVHIEQASPVLFFYEWIFLRN